MEIDPSAPEPVYEQLAAQLRERIVSGEYPPRSAIPSITRLCQETGLAVGTVRKAIAVLVDEGLVSTVPGKGSYVTGRG